MNSEYILIVEHEGEEHAVAGVSIEGVRSRAQMLYPGAEEIQLQSKQAWLQEMTTHERF